jgi:hypothetical protein
MVAGAARVATGRTHQHRHRRADHDPDDRHRGAREEGAGVNMVAAFVDCGGRAVLRQQRTSARTTLGDLLRAKLAIVPPPRVAVADTSVADDPDDVRPPTLQPQDVRFRADGTPERRTAAGWRPWPVLRIDRAGCHAAAYVIAERAAAPAAPSTAAIDPRRKRLIASGAIVPERDCHLRGVIPAHVLVDDGDGPPRLAEFR